mmetsp:Transcript_12298/g.31027  ORF Transcript_12298/g.31027 Transcript_12298/m.31027 type:complete len:151 (+) Transcript_12298:42-494(+)
MDSPGPSSAMRAPLSMIAKPDPSSTLSPPSTLEQPRRASLAMYGCAAILEAHAAEAATRLLAREADDALAQVISGLMYREGSVVPQSHIEAARLFRAAAEQGNAAAQLALGLCYSRGEGVRHSNPGLQNLRRGPPVAGLSRMRIFMASKA